MENISCFNCAKFSSCDILDMFKDDEGRVPVLLPGVIASDCTKYLKSSL
jgi:hypothetical protein